MSGADAEDSGPGQVSTRRVYSGRVISVDLDGVRFPDGSIGELEMVRHPGASAIVPLIESVRSDTRAPEPVRFIRAPDPTMSWPAPSIDPLLHALVAPLSVRLPAPSSVPPDSVNAPLIVEA